LPEPSAIASSVTSTAPTPSAIPRTSATMSRTTSTVMPAFSEHVRASAASLPPGASQHPRLEPDRRPLSLTGWAWHQRFRWAPSNTGTPVKNAAELAERLADADAVVEAELADRALVRAAALLHHRDRLADLAARLEVAKQDHRASTR
jgi:hypothetical protein